MAYLLTHFYEGGTETEYQMTLDALHPKDGLPAGQTYHVAGPTEGGWLIAAVWDSKASADTFIADVLMPALPTLEGGLAGPPQERSAEVHTLRT